MTKRFEIRYREETLARSLGWTYSYALQRKCEFFDLPVSIRGNMTFGIYLENLASERKAA